jgi:hypothetical protein
VLQAETKALQLHLPLDKAVRRSRWLSAESGSGTAYGKSRLPVLIEGLSDSSIFRLTRVTRIFQKKIFTETTPGARAACRARFFVARLRVWPRAAGFSCLQKKQENTEEIKAMPFQKGQSGNPAGRPRGIVNRATALAQNLLSERAEGIARKVIELAEEGDMAAIRVCMERLVPLIRHQPVAVELPPIARVGPRAVPLPASFQTFWTPLPVPKVLGQSWLNARPCGRD